ncbi:hypothetical protein FPV67DRAFT_1729335 [Lyophyllum atratum]|nr:hypothetical protein FPV67DRAFT_1729335 [Lyophyllum atratum]
MTEKIPLNICPRPEVSVSQRFNAPDADIIFQSSDGIMFRIHKMNLVACTEGFSPPAHCTLDDVAPLTEPAIILDILFQFVYPQLQPHLEAVDFEVFMEVAEAAEKYQVYSAINLCTMLMLKTLPGHGEEILMHGMKHDCRKLIAPVAPLLLDHAMEDMLLKVPERYRIPWVQYHSQWTRVWKDSINRVPDVRDLPRETCGLCGRLPHEYVIEVVSRLSREMSALRDLDAIFPSRTTCSGCCGDMALMTAWRLSMETDIGKLLPLTDIFGPDDTPFQGTAIYSEHANGATDADSGPTETVSCDISITFAGADGVRFLSSDNVVFYLHLPNVKACTKNLLPLDYNELVPAPILLSDHSSTLRLLFRYIYPAPHPDLESMDFDALGLLTCASEKYQIYPAIGVCNIRMTQMLPQNLVTNTSAVMVYAMRSQNHEVMDMAAPLLIGNCVVDMVKLMSPEWIIRWVQYHEGWNKIIQQALSFSSSRSVSEIYFNGGRSRLGRGAQALLDLDDTFKTDIGICCSASREDIRMWRLAVEEGIVRLPKFSTL